MNTFLRTGEFDEWLEDLRDDIAKARILARIRSAEAGNFGDSEPVGDGISECGYTWVPATDCIIAAAETSSICCYAEATNRRRKRTLNWRKPFSELWRRNNEKEVSSLRRRRLSE